MDGPWAREPDKISTTWDDMTHPSWLPASLWNQPAPPCARCGSAFAAHLDGKCPPAVAASPRRQWPRRHPWLSGAILLVALLGGIGIGTVSVSHVNYNTPNAHACYAYWQIKDADYAFQYQTASQGWRKLLAVAPTVTDPTLATSVRAFDEELGYADFPDAAQVSGINIEASCNALGYSDPAP
jgi:hypothetical protein